MLCQFLLYNEVNQLYVYLYPLPLGPPSHPHPIPPIQVVTGHRTKLPAFYSTFPLAIYFTQQCIHVDPNLPIRPTLPFPHCVHMSVLYVCISIPALQIGSSVPFFQIPHICINIQYLFFSFWLTSLCMTDSRAIHIATNDAISSLFVAE